MRNIMRRFLVSIFVVAIAFLVACSNTEEEWKYGDKQELVDTDWVNVTPYYDSGKAFSPVRYPEEQILHFGKADAFTLVTVGDADTVVTKGSYRYEHPMLWMTPEGGEPIVEAWISSLNRICFYDSSDFYEFERK